LNKKAGLSLGINTIIVLVIAMVVIAAGVSFIRTFFTAGEESLIGAFEVGEFGRQPDRNDQLVLSQGNTISMRGDDRHILRVGFYNIGTEKDVIIDVGDCVGEGEDGGTLNATIVSPVFSVGPSTAQGFETIFRQTEPEEDGSILRSGTFICVIQAWNAEEQNGGSNPLAETSLVVNLVS